MTNFENLQQMSVEQLAQWLDKNGQLDAALWTVWFDQKYCKNCESIICRYENSVYEFLCAWCELNDGCKFFPEMNKVPDNKEVIKLWLESEVTSNA